MASRRILRDFRLFKDNGAVCTDGSVAFYVPNTTTPLTLYSDQGLSVSIGTSEAFDVNGYAPEIYASTAIGVKVIITGTGVTTMTWDYYEQAPTAGTMETGSFTDPGADKLIMWDESAGSGGSAVACSLDTGLSISGTTLSLDAEIAALASVTSAADKAPIYSGSGTATTISLKAGTYTPTLTNITNVDSSSLVSSADWLYTRVGDIVTVFGAILVNATASGAATVDATLPIASNLNNTLDCVGHGSSQTIGGGACGIIANAVTDKARIGVNASDGANQDYYFSFRYRVL